MSLNPLSKLGHVKQWRERSQWRAAMRIGGKDYHGPLRCSRSAAEDDIMQASATRDDVPRVTKELREAGAREE